MSKLIQLVGPSGTGKSTVHTRLGEWLEGEGYDVFNVAEPGPLRDKIKAYRLRKDRDPFTETALFTADRYLIYHDDIFPRQEEENLVFLSARGFFDTFVYQGLIGRVDLTTIRRMNSFVPAPDLTLVLTVDGAVGYQRIKERSLRTGEAISPNETAQKIDSLSCYYRSLREHFPGIPMHMIDTTRLNRDALYDYCKEYISEVL